MFDTIPVLLQNQLMPHLKLDKNQLVQMKGASFTIGSDPSCDFSLDAPGVYARHLILQSRGDNWQAAKLSLDAPLKVNGSPVESMTLLQDGDLIQIGDVTFIWREENINISLHPPWKGLLYIFVIVLALLILIIWFIHR